MLLLCISGDRWKMHRTRNNNPSLEATGMVLYLEGRIWDHLHGSYNGEVLPCKECLDYGMRNGCDIGKGIDRQRVKWAVINMRC